jgi:hypothetical protein
MHLTKLRPRIKFLSLTTLTRNREVHKNRCDTRSLRPNRIVVAPMCQYSAVWLHDRLARHPPRSTLLSGAALLTIEATASCHITYADVGLWNDATEAAIAQTLLVRHANCHSTGPCRPQGASPIVKVNAISPDRAILYGANPRGTSRSRRTRRHVRRVDRGRGSRGRRNKFAA